LPANLEFSDKTPLLVGQNVRLARIYAQSNCLAVPVAAIFTIWAQVEVVIIAICTFAMYVTYGIVVAAVLWGKNRRTDERDMRERRIFSRVVSIAALVWLVSITGLLVFMSVISMSRQTLLAGAGVTAILALVVLSYWLLRKNKRSAAVQLAGEE